MEDKVDLARVHREIEEAKKNFLFVESHPTANGSLYVLSALQTTIGQAYTFSVEFPDTYPYNAPHVFVRKPTLNTLAPHQYRGGSICYIHPTMWNPGRHDLTFVLKRTAKWLNKYEVWLVNRVWPGAEIHH